MTDLLVREYGVGIETLIAVHGGPAAAGDLAPLARTLGERWRVLEPHQRGSRDRPLTVATHVQDLDDLIRERCGAQPVLVGHSWGAMLALVYAAHHPPTPAGLVLIGCGTFSHGARAEFEVRRAARLTPTDHASIAQVAQTEKDPNRRLAELGRVMTRVYGYDVDEGQSDLAVVDAVAHEETWADMVRLMNQGVYPAAFAAISCPVLMLHGEADPHPGRLTSEDLRPHIPHLEYREFPKCGHSPWLERQARDGFFESINAWIADQWQAVIR